MEGDMQAQEIFAILHKWGIHTLGQLAALDKQQLGARLGPEAVRMWERANGQSNRLLKLVRPPESFEERFEFENEIETASRSCSYCAVFWSSSQCGCAQFISSQKN